MPCDRDCSLSVETLARFTKARRQRRIAQKKVVSNHPRNIDREGITVWELLAADVERIEGICAVGAVFEEVFFRFCKFLAAFVLAEAVATAAHAGCLNGEDKVVVILSVEEWHKALFAGKTLVDEQIFLIVPHGIAEIDCLDSPAVAFELPMVKLGCTRHS